MPHPIRYFARRLSLAVVLTLALSSQVSATLSQSNERLYLPLTMRRWPPVPEVGPTLAAIDNSDLDNSYALTWTTVEDAAFYALQESATADFASPITYYDLQTTWSATNRSPGPRFYRIAGYNLYGVGPWSNPQSVTVFPLFVGLQIRWDGAGFIRMESAYDVGTHRTFNLDLRTDVDVIRSTNRHWYDPNPQGWTLDTWTSYYLASQGAYQSSTSPGDSDWKWSEPWKLAYWATFPDGIAYSGDNVFLVTGPHAGVTAFGVVYQYWELKNRDNVLVWQNGDWSQIAEPGLITLRFDAGSSHLLTYSDVLRRAYYQGNRTDYTVRYSDNLTAVSFFNGVVGTVSLSRTEPPGLPAPLSPTGGGPGEFAAGTSELHWVGAITPP